MFKLLFLIPTLPLMSSLLLGIFGRKLPKKIIAYVGTGSIGIVALLSIWIGVKFIVLLPQNSAYSQTLWKWMQIGLFQPNIAFRLDALSLIMTLVVTTVSFLIHIYSAEFMSAEEGYS